MSLSSNTRKEVELTNEKFALLDDIAGSLRNLDGLRFAIEDLKISVDCLAETLIRKGVEEDGQEILDN